MGIKITMKKSMKKSHYYLKNLISLFSQLPKKHRMIIVAVGALLLITLLLPNNNSAQNNGDNLPLEVGKRYQVALPLNASQQSITATASATKNSLQNSIGKVVSDL